MYNIARHNLTASPNPASCCLLHRTISCLQNNFSLPSHCRSLGLPSSILERASGDILPYKKIIILSLSDSQLLCTGLFKKKRIRFSLSFDGSTNEQGMNLNVTLLSPAAVRGGGPTHGWTGGGESTVRLSCKTSPLGPPLGARCFLPQVVASVLLLLRRQAAARSPLLSSPSSCRGNSSARKAPKWRR